MCISCTCARRNLMRCRPSFFSHGWPGSVAEFLDVLEPLSDPRGHGLDPAVRFPSGGPVAAGVRLVRGRPLDTGWGTRRIARAWAILMRPPRVRTGTARLGNDWGSRITPELGRVAPDAVVGVHVTQIFSFPVGQCHGLSAGYRHARPRTALTPEDQAALDGLRPLQRNRGSYLSRPFSAAADAGRTR